MAAKAWSVGQPFVEHLRAAAGALHAAGIAVYLSEYMDGAKYSDNQIQGDGASVYANIPSWTMRANADGTYVMAIGVRGGEHGLYERGRNARDNLVLREHDAEQFGRYQVTNALRAAGMDVKSIKISAFDNGFGTRDVEYLVTYAPVRPRI